MWVKQPRTDPRSLLTPPELRKVPALSLNLSFLGGAGTVTGSKYLIEHEKHKLLVDCGLFQGFKALRLKNWATFPVEPRSIDAVILTHAHLDHSGYLPLLIKRGFRGPVLCSHATADLCAILLPDAGYLQEKDAEYANRHGFSKHKPALPLYTVEDARAALEHLTPIPFDQERTLPGGGTMRLRRAGHILGAGIGPARLGRHYRSSSPAISADTTTPSWSIRFRSIGPTTCWSNSTYGDRRHDKRDPAEALAEIVGATIGRGGTVIIPAFAVGRAQSLLFHLQRLKSKGRLANVPIFLDSPMAVDASEIFCRDIEDHKLPEAECRSACAVAHYVRSVEESKALTANPMPKVIISASGMATGGRVLHHLKRYAPDPKNTILFAGFQAGGTRGAAMMSGAKSVKIHGEYVPVRAEVRNLDMLSAHADADEILRWLRGFKAAPRMTFVVHGEPAASDALRHRIEEELGWRCMVPDHGQKVELA